MISLSSEQVGALEGSLAAISRQPVVTIGGYAGTGKSVLVAELVRRTGFAAAAFTNKAASVLRGKGIEGAGTIHRLMYELVCDQAGRPVLVDGSLQFRRKRSLDVRGVVIDEASMVPEALHADLLTYGVPLIYVGDHGQLPPVGADARLMVQPQFVLETIHRNAGEVARFAEWLRMGEDSRKWIGISDAVEVLQDWTEDDIAAALMATDQVVCAYNRTRNARNQQARALIADRKGVGSPRSQIEPQEKMIVTANDYRNELFNGQIVSVRRAWWEGRKMMAEILPDDGPGSACRVVTTEIDPAAIAPTERAARGRNRLTQLDYGYCITCHKAQGSEYERLAVIEERSSMWEHARWAYTAASRAKKKLFWFAQKTGRN